MGNRVVYFFAVLIGIFLNGCLASAEIIQEFYRSPRAMGMGNAFTAVSDDADAVFYNPAGLALNAKTKLTLLNPKFDASKDDIKLIPTAQSTFSKLDSSAIQSIMGKHIYAGASIFPFLQMPYFMIGYLYSGTVKMYARNSSYPQFDATYIVDRGLVGGFGYEVRGISHKHWLRFGTTVKWITRRGLDKTFSVSDLAVADVKYFKNQIKGPNSGVGFGFGLQYEIFLTKYSDLVLGTSWQDIGNTSFGKDVNNSPPSIENNIAAGAAYKFHFRPNYEDKSGLTFSFEGRHLAQADIDPRLKMHFGMELRFDAGLLGEYALRGGVSDASLTAGIGWSYLDYLSVDAVAYSIENTNTAFTDREQRYMLQCSLSFEIFSNHARTAKQSDRRNHPRKYQ